MPGRVLLEVCADSVEACVAAEEGGADRVELCTGLVEGGTTPSAGTIALALERVRVPIVVLVRPRRGDFLPSEVELATIERDVELARRAGVAGVALGALRADGFVDVAAMRGLVAAARPMEVVFHRAFDAVRAPLEALEALVELGIDRVLTSGGASSAEAGAERIAELVAAARGRIAIVAAGGVRPLHAASLVARTGVREVHASAREPRESAMTFKNPELALDARELPGEWRLHPTSAERVRALRAALGA